MLMKHSVIKPLIIFFLCSAVLIPAGYFSLRHWLIQEPPHIEFCSIDSQIPQNIHDSLQVLGSNWIHLNDYGLWEMYTSGGAYERGRAAGKLSSNLIDFQERVFIERIDQLVPSRSYQRFLRLLIALFNQDVDHNIPAEYLEEIYGISRSAHDDYDFVGPKYDRMLHYHGAHDIGHMLQNYNLVGCTSFALWGKKSADSGLIVGRNFDFYVGDDFDKEKIVEFCRPDSGYGFMFITWGGMRGVVSGMNEKGLTVTLNAAKSVIPLKVADPVSLIAREILQYASNIDEAVAIAERRPCFVSESYLIASAEDHKAVVIEKSPHHLDIFEGSDGQLICTNHFQSASFINDPLNQEHIRRSASMPRYQRVQELLAVSPPLNVAGTARILRDQSGHGGSAIGMGNEKNINQLIAHHSVIFQPEKRRVWVSAGPYQVNAYLCYDLAEILAQPSVVTEQPQIYKKDLNLPPDSFFYSQVWINYLDFRRLTSELQTSGEETETWSPEKLQSYLSLNPLFFWSYEVCGDYLARTGRKTEAIKMYQKALELDIPTLDERERIQKKLKN